MLEKPDFSDEKIVACLLAAYGITAVQLTFLPIGADQFTAVYRAVSVTGHAYFVKLRSRAFDEIAVTLPRFLSDMGLAQIIAPMAAKTGLLWTSLPPYTMILYPFVAGRDGYEVNLSDRQWTEFGTLLKKIHTMQLPPALRKILPQETYPSIGRERLIFFLKWIGRTGLDDPLTAELAGFLRPRRDELGKLVDRTERLAQSLKARSLELFLCHADIHAGNLLITSDGTFFLVDWDAPILAPKERDLMSVGGGLFGGWRSPAEEEKLFYQGYGLIQLDPAALAYYRYERIIQDLAVECEQILSSTTVGKDRQQALHFLKSNFLPGHVLEIARRSDAASGDI